MPLSLKRILPLTLAYGALLPLVNIAYADASDGWPVYAPSGLYVVGEAGLGRLHDNKLGTLNTSIPASLGQKTSNELMEHFAVGDYFMNPDSITAVGGELGFNYFNKLHSNVNGILDTTRTTATQDTTAWSATAEGIASFNIIGNSVALFGKLGLGYAKIQRNIDITNQSLSLSGKDNHAGVGLAGGGGLRFRLTQNVALRTEVDGFTGENHTNYVAGLAGIEFNF